jgi:hypothetical protein
MSFDLVAPLSGPIVSIAVGAGAPGSSRADPRPFYVAGACTSSELQTALAGGVGQRLDAAVEQEAAAVEEGVLDTGLLRALGDRGADLGGGLHVVLADTPSVLSSDEAEASVLPATSSISCTLMFLFER